VGEKRRRDVGAGRNGDRHGRHVVDVRHGLPW
jgi:hypothetical protein